MTPKVQRLFETVEKILGIKPTERLNEVTIEVKASDYKNVALKLRDHPELKFEELIDVYDNSPSMLERAFHTGILLPELARRFGCGGFVGRASRRAFDARKFMPHEPYDRLAFDVPVLQSGDVNARLWVRFNEVRASLDLVERMVAELPEGPIERPISGAPSAAAEGVALVEGFRGDVLAWVRIGADGRVARCHLRDPSWFQWPVLEAAIEGNIVADFPLCNKSFNCSYSGHDV